MCTGEISRFTREVTHGVVLDRTCFYPEGGGQEADFGTLATDSVHCQGFDTRKIGEHIVHFTDSALVTEMLLEAVLTGIVENN